MGFFFRRGEAVPFEFEVFRVRLGTWANVLFGIREEVVWAGAAEVGAADLRGVEGERGGFGGGGRGTQEGVAHQLLEELALFSCHAGRIRKGDDQTVETLRSDQSLGGGQDRRGLRRRLRTVSGSRLPSFSEVGRLFQSSSWVPAVWSQGWLMRSWINCWPMDCSWVLGTAEGVVSHVGFDKRCRRMPSIVA